MNSSKKTKGMEPRKEERAKEKEKDPKDMEERTKERVRKEVTKERGGKWSLQREWLQTFKVVTRKKWFVVKTWTRIKVLKSLKRLP